MRLFVAAYPPRAIAEHFTALLDDLGARPVGLRSTPVAQVHLTLHFIGDVEKQHFDDTIESVERSAAGIGAFTLTPQCVIALPQRGAMKRVVAVETDRPGSVLEVHQRLVTRLTRQPRSDSRREYLPHLTIARIRPPAEITLPDVSEEQMHALAFTADRVRLMRSVLTPSGAEHHVVHEVVLG